MVEQIRSKSATAVLHNPSSPRRKPALRALTDAHEHEHHRDFDEHAHHFVQEMNFGEMVLQRLLKGLR
jgi:hypothetical protein